MTRNLINFYSGNKKSYEFNFKDISQELKPIITKSEKSSINKRKN